MERINDFKLNCTPKWLLLCCFCLLLARTGICAYEWAHPAERGPAVAWKDLSSMDESSSGKLRLYEFYAEWCSPCVRLERDVMTNSEIRSFIQDNFETVRITDRQREDGRNAGIVGEMQKKYRVFAFPTLVVTRSDGKAVGSMVGNASSLSVYRFLSRAVHSDN